MHTIGYLALSEIKENTTINYLEENGWKVFEITVNEPDILEIQVDALVILEATMALTCSWLIELRKHFNGPIYLLSMENDSYSKVTYLHLGVEACFPADIDNEEFFLTLGNLLTSYQTNKLIQNSALLKKKDPVQTGVIQLIPSNLSVIIEGEKVIDLTKKEFQIMKILYDNSCRAISYEELSEKMWSTKLEKRDQNNRIANLIFHLRNKIEKSPDQPQFIKTVRSVGYVLNDS
ncbi:hypothetical protein ATZ33_08255 [Enterococcus silesiacus]|uniref:OmpR/PhoB-type domain-containing protein n=1 Tax=Enterococcus silesiacus TaxID=332949 RepID=A0A0S3KAT5_9ENTE|nr:winged helix-turn-helix domain-containing protein [Enterococcus silesiacus]ALS01358.1 hypothetical protein ATZ33_08255 [Enterococcus silesiacus]OJG88595.1 hypothetical protein RV15_GL001780 [Enterococcus silesiacus]